MAEHGPIPKRSEERRRQNKPETPLDKVPVSGPVKIPPANPRWHAVAKQAYESLRLSCMEEFYDFPDWAVAYLLAEDLSRELKPQAIGLHPETGKVIHAIVPLKGAKLAAYLRAFAALGMTEGDRRRLGVERDRKPQKPALAAVTVMDEYRDALGG